MSIDQYDGARLLLIEGIGLVDQVVRDSPTSDEYHQLMTWLNSVPVEFGLPILRLMAKEAELSTLDIFEGCGDIQLVGEVTNKYGPILGFLIKEDAARQKAQVQDALQAVLEHDCENCPARDDCPNSTWTGGDGETEVLEADAVEAGDEGDDNVVVFPGKDPERTLH